MEASGFDSVVQAIQAEKVSLNARLAALDTAENALTALTGATPAQTPAPAQTQRRGPGRPPGSSAATASRRGRHGNRREQALSLVQETPGITIPQIATKMKIQPNYLYRVMPGLEQEGAVRRDDSGGWVALQAAA